VDEPKLYKVVDPDFGKRPVNRERDAVLDEKLFGHEVQWVLAGGRERPVRKGWHDCGMPFSMPYYHEKIQDAWLIVEELRRRGIALSIKSREDLDPAANNCPELIQLKEEKYEVQRWNKKVQRYDPPVFGKTAQEAICKTAFLVLGIT
jgi:hypothetical protein